MRQSVGRGRHAEAVGETNGKIPLIGKYLNRNLDLRVRLFDGLALTGMGIGVVVGAASAATGAGLVNILSCLASSALALILLRYAWRTGRYELCYGITIAALFLFLFPVMFFAAGGYRSGMPSFFETVGDVVGFVVTSVALGISMYLQVDSYRTPSVPTTWAIYILVGK